MELRKKVLPAVIALIFSTAEADSVSVQSNFLVRGHTQTNGEAAVQGSLSKSFDNGAYVGTWGSNIGFDGGLELDAFAGWAGGTEKINWDVGVLHHNYPNQPFHDGGLTSNFTEYYGKLSFVKYGIAFGYYHSPDYFSIGGREAGQNDYIYTDVNLISSDDHSLVFHYGSTISDVFEYDDWSVVYTKSFNSIDLFIEHHDTKGDLKEETTMFGVRRTF
jgi:uncharacterized protein (TIGR02001 family)